VAHAPLFSKKVSFESDYTILKSVSKAEIFRPAVTFRQFFLAILTFFLSMSLLLAYVATHQFTNPIQRLRREAQVIAIGNYHARVDVRTYDEIEELAKQFNVMAASLEQRDEEIASYQKHLEETVQERTGELRKEKDKLQAILDNVPSGFILLDPERTILSASAALMSITGKPASELVGNKCHDVIGNDALCAGCPTEEVLQSGKMATTITRGFSPEGEDRYLEHISVPLRRNGSVDNVLEIITDVTRRKRLQDQLVRSERLAATGEIAAVIAHEMRNSLTSTRMILQLLKETDSVSESDQESLDVALDSLGRMEGVVSNLLQLARPAQLEMKLDSIARVVHAAVEFARPQIARKDIDLVTHLPDDLPDLEIDGDRMKEALVNLILNASQSIESRGSIVVSAEVQTLPRKLRDLGEVRVSSGEEVTVAVQEVVLRKGSDVVVVRVQDSGCGMPSSHLRRIFDPFFTTKVDGTGLGLSFVKRVVNEHGGVVTVESEPGRGSTFSMIIPGVG